ncbi:MAG: glycine cleavage system aminomethyltransferase GcvT [Cellvibrionaceae bacterium]|nr:glycine cleavage system aminomethyltransferase GcvT [Cellvibrionaceae bacterium]
MSNSTDTRHSTLLKTPLYQQHQALQAKIIDFGGWALPLSYNTQLEEHHSVRKDAGMFDVSHMTVWDIEGEDVLAFLSRLLANDIRKATQLAGKALYSCMLNEQGGVIDDLIVYYLNDHHCRLVTNAATCTKNRAWLHTQAQDFAVTINEQPQLALIAVQGPKAIARVGSVLNATGKARLNSLKRFQGGFADTLFIGRTGYTGEDGVEIILADSEAVPLWQALLHAGVKPCGLGARDSLRLEAGMALYGQDLDEEHTPLASGLGWTVALSDDRDFIGKQALSTAATQHMVGLILEDKGVLRRQQNVLFKGLSIGITTSGGFSPSLNASIALARINKAIHAEPGTEVSVHIRQKQLKARVVSYPFISQT